MERQQKSDRAPGSSWEIFTDLKEPRSSGQTNPLTLTLITNGDKMQMSHRPASEGKDSQI